MPPSTASGGLTSSLQSLKITTSTPSSKPITPPRSSRSRSRQKPPPAAEPVDSWEDEADDTTSNSTAGTSSTALATDTLPSTTAVTPDTLSPQQSRSYPRAPPPTPAAATSRLASTDWSSSASKFRSIDASFNEADEDGGRAGRPDSAHRSTPTSPDGDNRRTMGRSGGAEAEEKRPEKSTAVASRLIAAGLGVKAPRRTEEQREYDRAIKVQEKKRREKEAENERKRKEESERAKKAIWDD